MRQFILAYFLLLSLKGNASPFICSEIFNIPKTSIVISAKLPQIFEAGELRALPRFNEYNVTASILPFTTIKGTHGGELLVIKKHSADQWYSGANVKAGFTHGDPRWWATAMGPQVGYYFGFKRINLNTKITVPSVKEFQGAIDRINKILTYFGRTTISIKFYEYINQDKKFPIRAYLNKWIDEAALPISQKGDLAIHDISYHLGAALIPNEVANLSRLQVKRALEFIDFAKANAMNKPELNWILNTAFLKNFLNEKAAEVDSAGNIIPILIDKIVHKGSIYNNSNYINYKNKNNENDIKEAMREKEIEDEKSRSARKRTYKARLNDQNITRKFLKQMAELYEDFVGSGESPNERLISTALSVVSIDKQTVSAKKTAITQAEWIAFEDLVNDFLTKNPDPLMAMDLNLSLNKANGDVTTESAIAFSRAIKKVIKNIGFAVFKDSHRQPSE